MPDNIIRQNQKARWGFSGSANRILIATETVAETGGVEVVPYRSSEDAARYNGGGTKTQIQGWLDEMGVEYPRQATKAELIELLDEQD